MREPTTVPQPQCRRQAGVSRCGDMLTLTPMDGWSGPHCGCIDRTVHTDWIITTGQIRDRPVDS